MASSDVLNKFDKDELDAIQWDSLSDEMARSLDYQVVASYDQLNEVYNAAKRG
jgi:spermidine/putrescine transport system substrate-binding protein